MKEPEFVAALNELEPEYQITRFRIWRGLIRMQPAEMFGAREAAITRLELGTQIPSL